MNTIIPQALFVMVAVLFNGIFFYVVGWWPKQLIITCRRHFLIVRDSRYSASWRIKSLEELNLHSWFWGTPKDRSSNFLRNPKRSLAKEIFLKGGAYALIAATTSALLVTGTGNVPPLFSINLLAFMLPIYVLSMIGAYGWHLAKWEDYLLEAHILAFRAYVQDGLDEAEDRANLRWIEQNTDIF